MIGPFRSIGEYSNPLYLYHGSLKSIYLDIFTQELWFFSLHLFSNCFSFSCGVLHHCIPNPFHSVTRHQNSFFASTFICSVTDVGIEKGSRTTIHTTQQDFSVHDPFNLWFTLSASPFSSYLFFNYNTRWPGVWWLPWWLLQHKELSQKLSTQD